jgi:hypothetical protein
VWLTPQPSRFATGKENPVLILQEFGWALLQVWKDVENFAFTGTRFRDLSARSESLYRLI